MAIITTSHTVGTVAEAIFKWKEDVVAAAAWEVRGSSDGVANYSFTSDLITSGTSGAHGFDNSDAWMRVGTVDGVYEVVLKSAGPDLFDLWASYDSVLFTDTDFGPASLTIPPVTSDGGYLHRISLGTFPPYTPLSGGPYTAEIGVSDTAPYMTYLTVLQGLVAQIGFVLQMLPDAGNRIVVYALDPTPQLFVAAASSQESVETGTQADWTILQQLIASGGGGGAPPPLFLMCGRDPDCGPLTYVYWQVSGAPDYTGSSYSGSRCGGSPLTGITATRLR
jgi:hypothetical protein